MFLEHKKVILAKIQMKCGANAYSWEYRAIEISNMVRDFVKEKMKEQHLQAAQDKVRKMKEDILRNKVNTILEEHPELCSKFINEEG